MLTAQDNYVTYTGNGATTEFAFDKPVYLAASLDVYTYDSTTDSEPQLVSTDDYTVTVESDFSGAAITFDTAPASGVKVGIIRVLDLSQDVDISDTEYVAPSVLEKALDRAVMMAQQLDRIESRALMTDAFGFNTAFQAGSKKIAGLADAEEDDEAVNLGQIDSYTTLAQAALDAAETAQAAAEASENATAASAAAAAASATAADASADSAAASVAAIGTSVTDAAASATAAAASETAAAASATAAQTAETNAETAETNAETAATNAASSASSASTSATNAAASETAAAASETAAAASATAAQTAETNAETAETAAEAAQAAVEAIEADLSANGKVLRTGSGAPDNGDGNDGDFYIDSTSWDIYGPKAAGDWGSATSIIGPAGSGSGDVIGPATSVTGNIPTFGDTSGNLLDDSGFAPADFATAGHDHDGTYEPADATILKDADIGVSVQAYDADTAKLDVADQTVTGGARITTNDLGNLSGNTITPDPGDRPIQKITNNGAGTIAPGTNQGAYLLVVKNTTGAGAITTSGWSSVDGDPFDTTTTSEFLCHCTVVGDFSSMTIKQVT